MTIEFLEIMEEQKEQVNHPSHYQGIECIDAMEYAFGTEAVITFCKLNAYKYRCRQGKKDGNSAEQDGRKADWYHAKALLLEGKTEKILPL